MAYTHEQPKAYSLTKDDAVNVQNSFKTEKPSTVTSGIQKYDTVISQPDAESKAPEYDARWTAIHPVPEQEAYLINRENGSRTFPPDIPSRTFPPEKNANNFSRGRSELLIVE